MKSNHRPLEFYYVVKSSVSEVDAVFIKYLNEVFTKSHNLYITRAKPKGYKAIMKNPIFSKGASSWFAKVTIEMTDTPEKTQSYLRLIYTQTLFFNLTIGKIYLYLAILFVAMITLLRFNVSDLKLIETILMLLLIFMAGLTLYYHITKWGKEEQQSEIRKQILKLLKSEDISLKRITNM